MGSGPIGDPNDPPHQVVLTQPFCMDATEVTVTSYKACVDAAQCTPPREWGMWINYPKRGTHPVNKVDWHQARTYCQYAGKDLPTEAQWEWSATGGDGREFAWGSEPPTCEHADFTPGILDTPSSDDGCNGGGTSAVGTHPKGAKHWPGGALHDMSGNVWEWCLDNYGGVMPPTATDPHVLKNEHTAHVVRGGGWNRSRRGIRVRYRGGAPADYRVPGLGFRCARQLIKDTSR